MPLSLEADRARKRQQRVAARSSARQRHTGDIEAVAGLSVADWISTKLTVPYGPHRGNLFKLAPWQVEFVEAITNPRYKEVAISTGRKCGKTGLTAAIVLAGLCGPLNVPHWRCIIGSVTLQHAAELRLAIVETAKASNLDVVEMKSPSPGYLLGYNDSRADLVSASNASGHALAADLAVLDEAGLLEERKRELWNNFHAALSGRNGTFVSLSVLGYSPMFRELLESEPTSDDVYFQLHQADADADIEDESQWLKANPALADGIKSLEYLRHEASRAVASPNNINDFKAYHLNLPANPARQPICTPDDWRATNVEPLPEKKGKVILACDLGGASSMTAATAYWADTCLAETWAAFPGVPDLRERGRADSVGDLYLHMERRGELTVQPDRKAIDFKTFLADCLQRLEGERIACLVVDRYRIADLHDAARELNLNVPIVPRGMGFKDGAQDVQSLLQYLHSGKIRHAESMLVAHACGGSHIVQDPMLNMKVDKLRSTSKTDAIMCLILACGQAARIEQSRPKRRRRRHYIA